MSRFVALANRKSLEFLHDRCGNFAIMTVILLPILLAVASLSIEVSHMMATKTRLSGVVDAAALAASSAMADQGISAADAKVLAIRYIDGQLGTTIGKDGNNASQSADVKIVDTPNGGSAHVYDVDIALGYKMQLSGLSQIIGLGSKMINVSGSAESATASQGAVSLYLVLDQSGSMAEPSSQYSNISKIDALKTSVQKLAAKLKAVDPNDMYVRTGAISYNWYAHYPVNLNWGESHVVNYVNALWATGGTDSSDAFKTAYLALKRKSEDNAHKFKNGQVPSKYIVFMTDGNNNYASADTATRKWCDDAKKHKIDIYTIAFRAPANGKALLNYCATDAKHYFDAQNANDLYKAFDAIGNAAAGKVSRLTG